MVGEAGRGPCLCLTSEQLEVREGLGEDPPALFLHRQRDHQQPIGQLRKVLDEVVLPVERSRETVKPSKWRLPGAVGQEAAGASLQRRLREQVPLLHHRGLLNPGPDNAAPRTGSGVWPLGPQSWPATRYLSHPEPAAGPLQSSASLSTT